MLRMSKNNYSIFLISLMCLFSSKLSNIYHPISKRKNHQLRNSSIVSNSLSIISIDKILMKHWDMSLMLYKHPITLWSIYLSFSINVFNNVQKIHIPCSNFYMLQNKYISKLENYHNLHKCQICRQQHKILST
jgi:hypothetical protein